jgi:hypothetical protein
VPSRENKKIFSEGGQINVVLMKLVRNEGSREDVLKSII